MQETGKPDTFRTGDRVTWNYWTDRRDSGWMFGRVINGPAWFNGILAYEVETDESGPFPAWKAAILLERVPVSRDDQRDVHCSDGAGI